MFFIVNHENSIIAADTDFLEGIGADDIYEAALLIKKGEVVLDELEQSISYFQQSGTFSKTELSTFLGKATLYEINEEDNQTAEEPQAEEPQDDALFNLAMPQESLPDEAAEEKKLDTNEEHIDLQEEMQKEEIFSLAETDEAASIEEDAPLHLSEADETVDTQPETVLPDIPMPEPVESEADNASDKDSDTLSREILGLVETDSETAYEVRKPEAPEEEEQDIDLLISDEPPVSAEEPEEEIPSASDDIPSILSAETEVPATEESKEESEFFDRGTETPTPKNNTNFQEIAELIGVSEEEYLHFLDDFRKESLQLEANLRSNDPRESREALTMLREASLLLHLPHITEKLNSLFDATSDEKSSIVDSYLQKVAEITGAKKDDTLALELMADSKPADESSTSAEEILSTDHGLLTGQETATENETKSIEIFIDQMDQIEAIPFDFSINEAADELTLPASLVSEFVIDFINQAKENLPVLQKAYEEKDLETIQTTAHMLKGASSNLRITAMAETLYELQFNTDLASVPKFITHFSGQLKALSLQMGQV